MHSSIFFPALFSLTCAQPAKRALPPAFFLAGDSTTAPNGGWGDAFVAGLTSGATGTNYGDSGATTGSFRSAGIWDEVLAAVEGAVEEYTPYVTIQFGHNDQKTGSGLDAFKGNLVQFHDEVIEAGGVPIFLTSLTRRSFEDGAVVENLANVVEMTKEAAEQTGALIGDLNAASMEYVNAIGAEDAHTYNLSEDDNTHLNEEGAEVFAGIVGMLLKDLKPGFDEFISIDGDLVAAVEAGEYYYPE